MKLSLGFRAFLEAAGVTAYVILFAIAVQSVQAWFMLHQVFPSPVLSLILVLLAFIVSALVCGSLVLLYPLKLFSAGRKDDAWEILFWSGGWLILFLFLAGLVAFLTV